MFVYQHDFAGDEHETDFIIYGLTGLKELKRVSRNRHGKGPQLGVGGVIRTPPTPNCEVSNGICH